MKSNNTIIFYAPTGENLPAHMLGGGERGCRRTREILCAHGYTVITVEKPNRSVGVINYAKCAVRAVVKALGHIGRYKEAIVYVVGFYEKNLPLEWLILSLAKLFGRLTIYEARNGRLVNAYNERNELYKFLMKKTLNLAEIVFAQGEEYLPFIKNVTGKDGVYTPNYVLNKNTIPFVKKRNNETVKIIYFGRVSRSKNVDVVLDTHAVLTQLGHNVRTVIIGGISPDYKQQLMDIVSTRKIKDKVTFLGAQDFSVIASELNQAHFFVFPSVEKMEGHSNSLTEAMTYGVVPIVSTAGFNASIVGRKELVIQDLDARKYAAVIHEIVVNKRWEEYSSYVFERIKHNYTEDIVCSRILMSIENYTRNC